LFTHFRSRVNELYAEDDAEGIIELYDIVYDLPGTSTCKQLSEFGVVFPNMIIQKYTTSGKSVMEKVLFKNRRMLLKPIKEYEYIRLLE